MPRNIVGAPVRGEDCFGREGVLDELEERVQVSSLLVSAPRRWGKTSVLREFRDRDPERRHYFDLYPVNRASHFIAEVAIETARPLSRVRQKVADFLGRSLDRVAEIRVSEVAVQLRDRMAEQAAWQDSATAIFSAIPGDHILILDEFPSMAKAILDRDRAEAESLLRWLRWERQRHGSPQYIFAGSTSLVELCRQEGLSHTVNDLELVSLPRFSRSRAAALLRGLFASEGVTVSERSLETALDLVGPEVPFFLQILTRAVLAEVRDGGKRITPELIRRVYKEVLLSSDYRSYLDNFRGRLDQSYLPREREVALVVLGALARHRDGLTREALRQEILAHELNEDVLDRVLVLLEGDFYISRRPDGSHYHFLNRYLADWWQRFHA